MILKLDFRNNYLIVQREDVNTLKEAGMIQHRSDNTTRVILGRFVLMVEEPYDGEE